MSKQDWIMNGEEESVIPMFGGTKKTYEQWLAMHPKILEYEIAKATGRTEDVKRIYDAISGKE